MGFNSGFKGLIKNEVKMEDNGVLC